MPRPLAARKRDVCISAPSALVLSGAGHAATSGHICHVRCVGGRSAMLATTAKPQPQWSPHTAHGDHDARSALPPSALVFAVARRTPGATSLRPQRDRGSGYRTQCLMHRRTTAAHIARRERTLRGCRVRCLLHLCAKCTQMRRHQNLLQRFNARWRPEVGLTPFIVNR